MEYILNDRVEGIDFGAYSEYVESNRFPGEKQSLLLRDYLRTKYADRKIDVIVAVTDHQLAFLLKYRHELFTHVPIVFVAVQSPTAAELAAGPGITGVAYGGTQSKTLDLALRLHPGTERVFIVSGTLEHDRRNASGWSVTATITSILRSAYFVRR